MKLEKEIRIFLDEICVELGFCLPPKDIENLVDRKYYEADQFVREIFTVEGMNPERELRLFRQVKKRFTDRFGYEVEDTVI
jgi:hypothetical protein